MLISFVNNIVKNNENNFQKRFSLIQKKSFQDTFEKSISFKSDQNETQTVKDDKSFEKFKKWAEATNFLSKIIDIVDNTGKILGSGYEGTTYEIPNNNKWIIKKYKRCNFLQKTSNEPVIREMKDISEELNIGQEIAYIEVPVGKYSHIYHILKRQEGKSYGVSHQSSSFLNEQNIKDHINYLDIIASFPQTAFDKCIKDVKYISDKKLFIDCGNPENLLLDTDKQEINFVDIIDPFNGEGTQFGEVLYALLDGPFAVNFNESLNVENKNKSIEKSSIIINKYLNAMKNQKVRFTSGRFFDILLDSGILNRVLNTSSKQEQLDKLNKLGLF